MSQNQDLTRMLLALMPDEPEVRGLLALLLTIADTDCYATTDFGRCWDSTTSC